MEFEKMRSGAKYRYDDPEIGDSLERAKRLCSRLMLMTEYEEDYREIISLLIPGIPDTSLIVPPFHCDHGTGIHLGENVFINYNCVMLDSAAITIGDNVFIGPNCAFYTPFHPMNYKERRLPQEQASPIQIGDDSWLGGNVVVCPGVCIGKRCIIAAGSVVTKDIPDDCMAAGVPAVIKKRVD